MDKIIIIIGSSVREHVICSKLKKQKIIVISDFLNPKINDLCFKYIVTSLNNHCIINYIKTIKIQYEIEYVVMNQEKFIFNGLVDELKLLNIYSIAPLRKYGKIEWSKSFARNLINKYGLSKFNPIYKEFITFDKNDIIDFIHKLNNNYVIKDNSLKGGKGVKVYEVHLFNIDDTLEFCKSIIESKSTFLIEEKLIGEEFSIHTITDGNYVSHTFPIKDFKRLYNNNKGCNTGSMGCISGNLNFLKKKDILIAEKINKDVIKYLQIENKYQDCYKGFLYGSFIKTIQNEIKIIEFNSRLGDPEAVPIICLLQNNLHDVFKSIINGDLQTHNISFSNKISLTRYIVPINYAMGETKKNKLIIPDNKKLYFGDIRKIENEYYTNNSRTLCVFNCGNNNKDVYEENINIINRIKGEYHYRTDIGKCLSYKSSGVDVTNYENILDNIKDNIKSTYNHNVYKNFGSFGGIYNIGNNKSIVQSIDGIGTKTILVYQYYNKQRIVNLGKDIVANNINDILVLGAKPITFMDYVGTNKINKNDMQYLIEGISESCRRYGTSLIGGETAEMTDTYKHNNNLEIVGCITGIINNKDIINGKLNIKKDDIILGLPSSGPHTNGYTLIRKILETCDKSDIELYIDSLLKPHKCYLEEINLLKQNDIIINGMAHITGGGLFNNIKRVLPDNLSVNITKELILVPEVFNFLMIKGNLDINEMYNTFNMGIGFVLIINKTESIKIKKLLPNCIEIGSIN